MSATVPPSIWSAIQALANQAPWPPRDHVQAGLFVEEARVHALLPLLFEEADLPAVVVDVLAEMRAAQFIYRARKTIFDRVLEHATLAAGTEPFMVFKGGEYRYRLYPSPEFRPSQDIDVLVPLKALPEMARRFDAAGFTRFYSDAARHLAQYPELEYEVEGILVEIHTSLNYRLRVPIDYDCVWNRKVALAFPGGTTFRPLESDALLFHAVNMAKDEFSSPLLRYVDLWLMLRDDSSVLAAVVADARRWQAQRAVYGMLKLGSLLMPELESNESVKEALTSLLTPREKLGLDHFVLPDPRQERAGHHTGRARQLWRKLWLIDSPWRRAGYLGYHIYAKAAGKVLSLRDRRLAAPHRIHPTGVIETRPAKDR
ncbi:MAG: nucleotidyltransferase family protein [Acidobacteriota bacterium]